ncbi:hypothetical protein SDC9_170346 [bioreactor metagenome]|uniref:Uncharacterized protein n=1 Tax=bioreactor metagenome TaxID=1076179 RepID=A0A645G7T2_9ZZZZ
MNPLHFAEAGVRLPVRADQSVAAEVSVVRLVAEVAAVGVAPRRGERVFAPLPDKASGETVVAVDHFPVFEEIAGAVAHGVGVFVHDERLLARVRPVLARMRNLAVFADADGVVL